MGKSKVRAQGKYAQSGVSSTFTPSPSLHSYISQSRLEAVSSLQSRVEAAERRSANVAETSAARIEGLEAKVAAAAALAAAGGGGGAVADAHIRHLEEEVWGLSEGVPRKGHEPASFAYLSAPTLLFPILTRRFTVFPLPLRRRPSTASRMPPQQRCGEMPLLFTDLTCLGTKERSSLPSPSFDSGGGCPR